MAAEVEFNPLTDRGSEMLDELQRRTEILPFKVNERTGARTYYLASTKAGVEGFDVMLDRIDADWREHLIRTGQ